LLMDAPGEPNSTGATRVWAARRFDPGFRPTTTLGVRRRRARFASMHRTAKQPDAERPLYIA